MSLEDGSNSFLAAGLIKQLEEDRQRLTKEVDRLESALEAERAHNATEWQQFFQDAGLTNTVTGDAIRSLDDFRVWKVQLEALRRAQESRPAASSAVPPHSNKDRTVSSYNHKQHNRLLAWFPAVCILLLFVSLCVYSFYANSLSLDVSDNIPVVDDRAVSSSVDYKTSYVGSINSDFIHRDTCRHAENIQKKNRVYYESVSDALADGRVKCSECFP